MSLEVNGRLYEGFEEQQVTETFKKREFILEIQDGQYPQYVKFQLTQDRCSIIDQYPVGTDVRVSFNLTGRPFTNRENKTIYFTNLNAWRIDRVAPAGDQPPPPADSQVADTAANQGADDMDDLPF